MAATLRQIAEELNVSTALVSCVLNEKPGVWASEATRARIMETASRLNYLPSRAARALATGKTMFLAVSPADSDWQHARFSRMMVIRGLIDAATHHKYRVMVLPSEDAQSQRKQFESLVRSKECDGICLNAEQADKLLYNFLREHDMPFVVIGNPGVENVPRVDHDNFSMYYETVSWIAAQGRRRIALIPPAPVVGDEPLNQHFARVIEQGYAMGMREAGGESDPVLMPQRLWTSDEEIMEWLHQVRPNALILRGIASTLQWKFALSKGNVRIPDDVLLLAHLNPAELSYMQQGYLHRGLACHIHDPHEAGQQAGELLISWINGHSSIPSEPVFVSDKGPQWC